MAPRLCRRGGRQKGAKTPSEVAKSGEGERARNASCPPPGLPSGQGGSRAQGDPREGGAQVWQPDPELALEGIGLLNYSCASPVVLKPLVSVPRTKRR